MAHGWRIPHVWLEAAGVAELQRSMAQGHYSAQDLVGFYTERTEALNARGPAIRAVVELNPDAADIAATLDRERAAGRLKGPLHGIPVLVKDNIDTADRMETTAGSLALLGTKPVRDATVIQRLRHAGAIIVGKANMSEWANFRSTRSSSGWSARGGQARNPHSLDRSPSGSSSGSATAVAAAMAPIALGTETDGSIISPSAANGVVGLKPTVGLTSRAGVIPIAASQDTVGPNCLSVEDAALVLSAIAGPDPRDPATMSGAPGRGTGADYTRFLDPNGLKGARIGVPRAHYFGYSGAADQAAQEAIDLMRRCGATIVDPADIPTVEAMRKSSCELEVLLYEFKAGVETYLRTCRPDAPIRSLFDLIEFNRAHAGDEMPHFGQELFEMAWEKGPLTDPAYLDAIALSRRLSRDEGIDKVMDDHNLDALVMPSMSPAWKIDWLNGDHVHGGCTQAAAMAGYPALTVPAGFASGLPLGVAFVGRAYSEPTLIRLAYAYEQASKARRPPAYRVSTAPDVDRY